MTEKPLNDQVVLEGDRAIANALVGGPGGRIDFKGERTVSELTRTIASRGMELLPWSLGLVPTNLPLRAVYNLNGWLVFLIEYPPGLRTMRWIREDSPERWGSGATYRDVAIALPYVVFFVAVSWQGTLGNCSVYFRTEHVQRADFHDDLLDCHFLNCSVNAHGVYCWMCSQYMRRRCSPGESALDLVRESIDNFWFAGSNLSSEDHEGASFFGKGSAGRHQIRDPRVLTIGAWEKVSVADAAFALDVPWNPAGRTVLDVFTELTGGEQPWPFATASAVANLILTRRKKGGQP